jgi:8-oxo-dGTP pyrophosphatase MutT (NUDIX family)
LLTRALQRYWRLSRGQTLGAQGVVLDGQGRVLLIKHTYRPGWHFPGGGVERKESAVEALRRELREEAGVLLTGEPELFGFYANFRSFPGDHIALYLVRDWEQPQPPQPNYEIAGHGFFAADELPGDIHDATARRLRELLDGARRSHTW